MVEPSIIETRACNCCSFACNCWALLNCLSLYSKFFWNYFSTSAMGKSGCTTVLLVTVQWTVYFNIWQIALIFETHIPVDINYYLIRLLIICKSCRLINGVISIVKLISNQKSTFFCKIEFFFFLNSKLLKSSLTTVVNEYCDIFCIDYKFFWMFYLVFHTFWSRKTTSIR